MVKIITDSTADFTAAEAAELGIDIDHLRTRFGDEEYVDGIGLSPMQFYEKLVESDVMPCTSQPSPAEFESAFSAALETADEVVAITISAELSGTYQSAVIAAGGFDGRVRVVDSRSASIGEQILVRYAARLASEGRPAAEIESLLAENRSRICVLALLDTLEYLKRGGRISAAVAFAGGVLSIKPVVTLRDGAVALVGKARGSKKRRQPAQPARGKARHRLLNALPAGLHRPLRRAADEICLRQRRALALSRRRAASDIHRQRHRDPRRPRRHSCGLFRAQISLEMASER